MMPRPLPDHLIPTIKEVNDVDTTQGEPLHGLRNGGPGPDDGTESTPVADNTPRGTVAPSEPTYITERLHIGVSSVRSAEDGIVNAHLVIGHGLIDLAGTAHILRDLLCAALETLDAAVADHHAAGAWDQQRRVVYGDPITARFIAKTDYIGGDGT